MSIHILRAKLARAENAGITQVRLATEDARVAVDQVQEVATIAKSYGEIAHALSKLARAKGATQDEIDRAFLGEFYAPDKNQEA